MKAVVLALAVPVIFVAIMYLAHALGRALGRRY